MPRQAGANRTIQICRKPLYFRIIGFKGVDSTVIVPCWLLLISEPCERFLFQGGLDSHSQALPYWGRENRGKQLHQRLGNRGAADIQVRMLS